MEILQYVFDVDTLVLKILVKSFRGMILIDMQWVL